MTNQAIALPLPAARRLDPRALLFATSPALAPLVLRLTLGLVMFPHGAQKALGWFGGHGFAATMAEFRGSGIPGPVAALVVAIEFLGPLLLVLGLGTRLVALGFVGLMLGAIATVHLEHGFFMNWFGQQAGEGYEYHLLMIGMALALLAAGGGRGALDRRLAKEDPR